jgi:hypothetical protein
VDGTITEPFPTEKTSTNNGSEHRSHAPARLAEAGDGHGDAAYLGIVLLGVLLGASEDERAALARLLPVGERLLLRLLIPLLLPLPLLQHRLRHKGRLRLRRRRRHLKRAERSTTSSDQHRLRRRRRERARRREREEAAYLEHLRSPERETRPRWERGEWRRAGRRRLVIAPIARVLGLWGVQVRASDGCGGWDFASDGEGREEGNGFGPVTNLGLIQCRKQIGLKMGNQVGLY